MSGITALFSDLHPKIRIIIKEKHLPSLHWCAHQVRPINLKDVIKEHRPLLFLYWNLLEEKKNIRETFQFHSLQSTQVFIALCFSLSTSRREAWHLVCTPLLFMMLFTLQNCAASDLSIPSDHSYWHAFTSGPVQKSTSQSSMMCPSAEIFVRQLRKGQDSFISSVFVLICVCMWVCSRVGVGP